jgi:hypothetical protein
MAAKPSDIREMKKSISGLEKQVDKLESKLNKSSHKKKRAPSEYNLFVKKNMKKLMAEGRSIGEASKIVSELWSRHKTTKSNKKK